jgi:septum formation protein
MSQTFPLRDAPIILASGSPRRRQLLGELLERTQGSFEILVSSCDESIVAGESPRTMVERLAITKARHIAAQRPDAVIIGADTTVAVEDTILSKPESFEDACRIWSLIQGREHEVLTGHAVVLPHGRGERVWSISSRVRMTPMTQEDMQWYWDTKEPADKAGAYAIQGHGGRFVVGHQGSYSNIVGMDVESLAAVLEELGMLR